MSKRKLLLPTLALCLVLAVAVVPAMAYFTDHTEADGTVKIELGFTTEMEENVEGTVKTVKIKNNEDSNEDCWVRAKAIAGGGVTLAFKGENWSQPDDEGWCYYSEVLKPNDQAADLTINITPPEGAKEGDQINVAVVYESTKAVYNEDGTPTDAEWDLQGINDGLTDEEAGDDDAEGSGD